MMQTITEVILVNERDEMTGTMEKMEAHQKAMLHRAFSVFIFNSKGEMLLQQRASAKYHSPDLWSNACCSHPIPGEKTIDAAHRRLREELGFDTLLEHSFSFIYQTPFDNGLTEHEFDHVYVGAFDGIIKPDAGEVKDFCYMGMDAIRNSMELHPHKFTTWFRIAFPKLELHLQRVHI